MRQYAANGADRTPSRLSFGKVGVLCGGRSAEREISLMSGSGVHEALCSAGVDAHLFDMGQHSLADLEVAGFERVFITLHGRYGEDGTLQGALELLGIPYTGSGLLACALAIDKIMTKRLWLQHGLPTPQFAVLDKDAVLQRVPEQLGLPLILKPSHEGSTLGLSKVGHETELKTAYAAAVLYDDAVLAEQFIDGRELTVALLGSGRSLRALPIIEIVAPKGNYDYDHKYFSEETQYFCPADLPDEMAYHIQQLSMEAYRTLGCEGWGRVDLMLDAQNRVWLLELNTSPGMTSHSLVPMAARAAGITYSELCVAILADASCKVWAPLQHVSAQPMVAAVSPVANHNS